MLSRFVLLHVADNAIVVFGDADESESFDVWNVGKWKSFHCDSFSIAVAIAVCASAMADCMAR